MVVYMMKFKKNQKLSSITLTSGSFKDLSTEYELLKIRGSVSFQQDICTKEISTHGHSSFQYDVIADVLKNTGSCVLKSNSDIKDIVNTGYLKLKKGQTTRINSSGKLTVEDIIYSEKVDLIGIVHAKEINSRQFHLKLSGESVIERLISDEINVEKEKTTFSLFKKKLRCKYIKGSKLHISHTDTEVVEGDTVIIGKNCNIQTLYYKENYIISPNAKVQQIIRSEK